MTVGIRDVRLGRARFVTFLDELTEPVGGEITVTGTAFAPGEQRARQIGLALPVRGDEGDTDPLLEGDRLRRQVRAMLQNAALRLEGLYLRWDMDPDLNGWLIVGGGDLSYVNGGPTLGEYRLKLADAYMVGNYRTARPARRLSAVDRRLATTPRDHLGVVFSTAFAAETAATRLELPVGASDPLVTDGDPLELATFASLDGAIPYASDLVHGEVVNFELGEDYHGLGDVVVLDRQGQAAPGYTLVGDADPQGQYGWEELYGPDQPISAGDPPVVQNGLCRVRYVESGDAFAIDAYTDGAGYVEEGRVTFWLAGTTNQYNVLVSAGLAHWTPERAVIKATLRRGTTDRCDVYITLQRGWSGPRVEAYGHWTFADRPPVAIRVVPYWSGDTTRARSDASGTVTATDYGAWTGLEPWAYLLPSDTNGRPLLIAVLQEDLKMVGQADTSAYGATRNGVALSQPASPDYKGYASVHLGVTARGSEAADAATLGETVLYDQRAVPSLIPRA